MHRKRDSLIDIILKSSSHVVYIYDDTGIDYFHDQSVFIINDMTFTLDWKQ